MRIHPAIALGASFLVLLLLACVQIEALVIEQQRTEVQRVRDTYCGKMSR